MKSVSSISLPLALGLLVCAGSARVLHADADCLSCHGEASMQDASGHSIAVNADKFHASIHGTLKCNDCHTAIHDYPHPQPAPVNCESCHADEAKTLRTSVHADGREHPCTSCHGNAHEIVTKADPKSTVYPLNVPKTCGSCHGNPAIAKKHGLPNVYSMYLDSIHGFALGKEGLLVAANCTSCHGSHKILSHTDPQSPTYRTNIAATCG